MAMQEAARKYAEKEEIAKQKAKHALPPKKPEEEKLPPRRQTRQQIIIDESSDDQYPLQTKLQVRQPGRQAIAEGYTREEKAEARRKLLRKRPAPKPLDIDEEDD